MTPDSLFLGIDLGTSSLKCGLFDLTGCCASADRVSYPSHKRDGGAEQHCDDWWEALSNGVRFVARQVDRRRIAAIAVGGHAPSPVFLDADLQPVCPVIPWFDSRCKVERDHVLQMLGRSPKNGGERLMVQVAARALWLRKMAPCEFARAALVLHSGDYLVARLTGHRILTSLKSADVFDVVQLNPNLLPTQECRPGDFVAGVSPDIAERLGLDASVPVITGGLDSFLACIGSGICEPGDACLNTGSSSTVALVAGSNCSGRFEWGGRQILSRPTCLGGRILEEAQRYVGFDGSLDDLLLEAARLEPPLEIQHHLAEFLEEAHREGLNACHRLVDLAHDYAPAEVFRLLLDVIFLSQRTVLAELEQQGGSVQQIRSIGGLTTQSDVNQLQANALGRTIEVPRFTNGGALGAAMLAATAMGNCTPREASAGMVRPNLMYRSLDDVADRYDRLMDEIHAATR